MRKLRVEEWLVSAVMSMDHGRWKKLIKIDDDQDGGWVSVSSGTGSPG